MPAIGLGVYQSAPGPETQQAVLSAIKLGYRHIDTAQCYNNEADVGKAIKAANIPREELWVTTKLWLSEYTYPTAVQSVRASLQRLQLTYVDLFLLHAPGDPRTRADAWRALEEAHAQGLIKHIGVSNFGIAHLEKLFKTATVLPEVNQIELSPFLQRKDVVDYCRSKGIVVQAYSPLCKGETLQDPRLKELAANYNVSTAQLLIRWSLQKGFVPLPKSVNPRRQEENLNVNGFEISKKDMDAMDALEEGLVTGWDPISTDAV